MSALSSTLFVLLLCILLSPSLSYKSIKLPLTIFHSSMSLKAVTEVTSVTTLDEAVSSAGDALVVVDYSTTWCGPCKLVMPKYVELSDKYEKVIFLKCIGDSSKEAGALMKREGVRSVPTFHFWKGGSKIEVVSGARIEDVEAAILSNQ